jgi:hypothetical protein
VGIKECVATLVPDAAWLVNEVASPPIIKMLTEYLERLPLRGARPTNKALIPSDLIATLKVGVELRNRLSHRGAANLEYRRLQETLEAVRSVLWLLDYYRGYEWALDHVDEKIRQYVKS